MSEKILYEPPMSNEILLQVEGFICASTEANWGTTAATLGDVTEVEIDNFFK